MGGNDHVLDSANSRISLPDPLNSGWLGSLSWDGYERYLELRNLPAPPPARRRKKKRAVSSRPTRSRRKKPLSLARS